MLNLKTVLALCCAFLLTAFSASAATAPQNWEKLERKVRDNSINKRQARVFLSTLRPKLDSYFYAGACVTYTATFVFPVEGYGYDSIGGKKGSGYIPRGYDFYDADKHGDHPAHDIFIRDSNHDCLDDSSGQEVKVLSVSPGVVVSSSTGWTNKSKLRGGNYVWVYDPFLKGLFYYAHLDKVAVETGDIVKPGQGLGTVGRTGRSASRKKSPTHLHFMYVTYGPDGTIKPRNVYSNFVRRTMPDALETTGNTATALSSGDIKVAQKPDFGFRPQ